MTLVYNEYKDAGLIKFPKELKQQKDTKTNQSPAGKPTQKGGRSIYPTPQWHFQQPA